VFIHGQPRLQERVWQGCLSGVSVLRVCPGPVPVLDVAPCVLVPVLDVAPCVLVPVLDVAPCVLVPVLDVAPCVLVPVLAAAPSPACHRLSWRSCRAFEGVSWPAGRYLPRLGRRTPAVDGQRDHRQRAEDVATVTRARLGSRLPVAGRRRTPRNTFLPNGV